MIPAQAKLKALRYPVGAVDGTDGDRTTAAVQLLQRKAGLPVTGELDDDTLAALGTAEALPVAAKDANLAQSRTVQGGTLAAGGAAGVTVRDIVALTGMLRGEVDEHIRAFNDRQQHRLDALESGPRK